MPEFFEMFNSCAFLRTQNHFTEEEEGWEGRKSGGGKEELKGEVELGEGMKVGKEKEEDGKLQRSGKFTMFCA